ARSDMGWAPPASVHWGTQNSVSLIPPMPTQANVASGSLCPAARGSHVSLCDAAPPSPAQIGTALVAQRSRHMRHRQESAEDRWILLALLAGRAGAGTSRSSAGATPV